PRLEAGSRAREGDEILEADGHRDRPERTEAVALEPAPHRAGQRAGALQHERRVQGVDLERLLLADGLALPLVRHRALRETAGLGEEVLAPAAEPRRELRQVERPEIGDGPDVTLVQETLGLGSDPRNDPDPQRIEKRLDLLRSHDREPVGLLKIGGDLGDERPPPGARLARSARPSGCRTVWPGSSPPSRRLGRGPPWGRLRPRAAGLGARDSAASRRRRRRRPCPRAQRSSPSLPWASD